MLECYSTSESMKYEEMICIFDGTKILLFICITLHSGGVVKVVSCKGRRSWLAAQNHVPTTDQPSPVSQIMTSFNIIITSMKTNQMEFAFGALHHQQLCWFCMLTAFCLSAYTNTPMTFQFISLSVFCPKSVESPLVGEP